MDEDQPHSIEPTPPSFTPGPPPTVSPQPSPDHKPPTPMVGAGIGSLILIVSVLLCYVTPLAFLLGFVGAVACLFVKGYRCIFVGYIITVGVLLLAAIAYCSVYPPRFD